MANGHPACFGAFFIGAGRSPPLAEHDAFFQAWRESDAVAGPQRAFHLARRLPDQMRGLGRHAVAQADWALAHTLFWRGQFEPARALLTAINRQGLTADGRAGLDLELLIPAELSWILAALGEVDAACAQARHALIRAQEHVDDGKLAIAWAYLGVLHCMLDRPAEVLIWSRWSQSVTSSGAGSSATASTLSQAVQRHMAALLEYWALSRLGDAVNQAANERHAQTALAALRALGRAHEARGFSLYAQAVFEQSPRHAQTHLDAALELNARCGLHHWEARLLRMKSACLDAAGQLAEASRFQALARQVAQRQNAQLFLTEAAGLESRPNAGTNTEFAA